MIQTGHRDPLCPAFCRKKSSCEANRADKLEFAGEGKGIREKGKGNARERQNL